MTDGTPLGVVVDKKLPRSDDLNFKPLRHLKEKTPTTLSDPQHIFATKLIEPYERIPHFLSHSIHQIYRNTLGPTLIECNYN